MGKYERKRKKDVDDDTTEEGQALKKQRDERKEREDEDPRNAARRRSTRGSEKESGKKEDKRKTDEKEDDKEDGDTAVESMSIADTNALRAKLGLAPLVVDDGPQIRDAEDGESEEKIVTENSGTFEFRHRKARDITAENREREVKEKIETQKRKHQIHEQVLTAKGLADDDDNDDAAAWVRKMRDAEEQRKLAAQKSKQFDELDEQAAPVVKAKPKAIRKPTTGSSSSVTAGLVVAHSKAAFLEGAEQILVLEDKGVLDTNDDEVLINPNMRDDERHRQNTELRKGLAHHRAYDDIETDEWGNPIEENMLSKYDGVLEGGVQDPSKRTTFRLDDKGEVDLEREREAKEVKRRLLMEGRRLESLEQSKFTVASEFYTQEEMLSFRRVKKKKDGTKTRKRVTAGGAKTEAAEELSANIDDAEEKRLREEKMRKRRQAAGGNADGNVKEEQMEDGEVDDVSEAKPKERVVDMARLKKTAAELAKEAEDEDDDNDDEDVDNFGLGVDLTGVVIDDDAETELHSQLEKARRMKVDTDYSSRRPLADDEVMQQRVQKIVESREQNEETIEPARDANGEAIVIDATMEYCRGLGETLTYGLAGNREDADDVEALREEAAAEAKAKGARKSEDEEEEQRLERYKERQKDRERRRQEKRSKQDTQPREKKPLGSWRTLGKEDEDEIDKALQEPIDKDSSSSDDEDRVDVLGDERDASKGVAAMLRLAAEKGYLDQQTKKKADSEIVEKLKSKRHHRVEQGRFDIDDKYQKKLERMGTTSRGPISTFQEKEDYKPAIEMSYVDEKGRELGSKDAFRQLSWKFHGKGPGKKQTEKRAARMEKRELLKKMNSSDTPLGTLEKQLKKQSELSTPYLVLSGSNASSTTLQKKD